MPSVSPRSTSKLIPATALTVSDATSGTRRRGLRPAARRRRRAGAPCRCRPSAGAGPDGQLRRRSRRRAPRTRASRPGTSRRRRGRRSAAGVSGGSCSRHLSRAYAQRGANRQPAWRVDEIGRAARDRHQSRVARHPRSWGCCASATSCRASSCRRTASWSGAFSTIRPPYITAISSVCPATTPRSWVTRISDMLRSRALLADQLEDLGLDRDVEGGGRLVGEQQRRAARQRDRDHHALAHAARQLVRVLIEPSLGLGDADVAQQLDRRSRGRRCGPSRGGSRAAR